MKLLSIMLLSLTIGPTAFADGKIPGRLTAAAEREWKALVRKYNETFALNRDWTHSPRFGLSKFLDVDARGRSIAFTIDETNPWNPIRSKFELLEPSGPVKSTRLVPVGKDSFVVQHMMDDNSKVTTTYKDVNGLRTIPAIREDHSGRVVSVTVHSLGANQPVIHFETSIGGKEKVMALPFPKGGQPAYIKIEGDYVRVGVFPDGNPNEVIAYTYRISPHADVSPLERQGANALINRFDDPDVTPLNVESQHQPLRLSPAEVRALKPKVDVLKYAEMRRPALPGDMRGLGTE